MVEYYAKASAEAARAVSNLMAVHSELEEAEAPFRRSLPHTAEIAKLAAKHGIRGAARRIGCWPSTISRRLNKSVACATRSR